MRRGRERRARGFRGTRRSAEHGRPPPEGASPRGPWGAGTLRRWSLCGARGGSGGSAVVSLWGSGRLGWVGGGLPAGHGQARAGRPVASLAGLGEVRAGRRWSLCGARGGSGGSAVASLPGSGSLGRVGGLRRGRLPAGAWGRSAVWPCEAGDAWAGAPAGPEKAGVSRRASAGSPRLSSGYPGRGPGEPGVCLGSGASGGGSGKARASSGHPPAAAGGEPGPGRTRAQGRGPSPGSGADYCALHGDA